MSNLAAAFPAARLFYINMGRYNARNYAALANALADPFNRKVVIDRGFRLEKNVAVVGSKQIEITHGADGFGIIDEYTPTGGTLAKLPASLGADVSGVFHLTAAHNVVIHNFAETIIGARHGFRTCLAVVYGSKKFHYEGNGTIAGADATKGPWCGILLVDSSGFKIRDITGRGSNTLVGDYTANALVCMEVCSDFLISGANAPDGGLEELIDFNYGCKNGRIENPFCRGNIQTCVEIGNAHNILVTGLRSIDTPQALKLFNYAAGDGFGYSLLAGAMPAMRNTGIRAQGMAEYTSAYGAAVSNAVQIIDGGDYEVDFLVDVHDQVTQPTRFVKINGGLQDSSVGSRNGWVGQMVPERLKLKINSDQASTNDATEYDAPADLHLDLVVNAPVATNKFGMLLTTGGAIQDDPATSADYQARVHIERASVIGRSYDSADAAGAAAGGEVSINNALAGVFSVAEGAEGTFNLATGFSATGTNIIPRLLSGVGSPEGVVAARIGTIYRDRDASSLYGLWEKRAGNSTTTTGWRPLSGLKGSKAYDPPSLALGAETTTTVTVTGAVVGDIVQGVAFSNDLAGLKFIGGSVDAPDTATIALRNVAGTNPYNAASGTVTVFTGKP